MRRNPSTLSTTFGDVRIYPLPSGRAVSLTKCVRIMNTMIFLGVDGKLYCNKIGGGFYYSLAQWGFSTPLVNGMVKLGIITKKQADEHFAAVAVVEARAEAKRDLASLREVAHKYGVKIGERELSKIRKHMEGDEK